MEKLRNLPIIITQVYDSHADESDVEPSRSKKISLLPETFNIDQMMILHLLLREKNIDPVLFRLLTRHGVSGYFERKYGASITLRCEDVLDREHTLIDKSTNQLEVFQRWENPSGWIELNDLKGGEKKNE